MGFWFFDLIVNLLIPISMIGFGSCFLRNAPTEINHFFGYRTPMSAKNRDTWIFAHRFFGKLWRNMGWFVLVISILAMLFLLGHDIKTIGIYSSVITGIQLMLMLYPIIPTERALKKTFDKFGYRKEHNSLKSVSKTSVDHTGSDEVEATIKAEPDFPYPFGYKICWYAIKNETPQSVIEQLELKVVRESNWKDGIDSVSSLQKRVFISPPLDGYVLAVNIYPDDKHEVIKKHALPFEEFQYFGSHRIVGYYAWAKFLDGKIIHSYCYIGERGEITWCEGIVTPEEIGLGFDKFPANTDELLSDDFDYNNLPDEESVLAIAKEWGIDTSFESKTYEKGTGFICEFLA